MTRMNYKISNRNGHFSGGPQRRSETSSCRNVSFLEMATNKKVFRPELYLSRLVYYAIQPVYSS